MFKGISAVLALVSIVCFCFPAWSTTTPEQGEEGSRFDAEAERIGELRLGLPENDVHRIISCKPKKGKETFEGATGEYVQTWKYPECGVVLKMGFERKGGAKVVESISITSPSDLVTGRGIHIGSMESEVAKAYGRYRDEEESKKGARFVAGSIFDGMIFDFRDGKVIGMFLGAAAE